MPTTVNRVPANTPAAANRRITDEIAESIVWHTKHPGRIDKRLEELDREWDIERLLEANASALAFTGTMLGIKHHPRWLLVPALVTGFLFQHAGQGWCPPIPLLRRLGFRTAREIETERTALKVIRGDFARLQPARKSGKRASPRAALKAARA